MNTEYYIDYLSENGYVVISSLLNLEEVDEIRAIHSKIMEERPLKTITPTQFISGDLLERSVLKEKVVNCLKGLFRSQGYCLYPNFTIRESIYLSFHNDLFFLPEEIERHVEPVSFLQCSIYLQDNDALTGGGVTVIPGSHLLNRKEKLALMVAANDGTLEKEKIRCVESKAGDLVLWDSRVVHSSTKPLKNPEQLKIAVQWSVSKKADHAHYLLEYFKSRSEKMMHVSDYEAERPLAYFMDMKSINLSKLDKEEQDMLLEKQVQLMTLDSQQECATL